MHALYGVVVGNVESDGELATRVADAIAQLWGAVVIGVVVIHAHAVLHRIDQGRVGGGVVEVMADLVRNRVVPHVQRKQFTDIRAGW